ncbi:MAG: hypothetical protein ACREBA_00005, partial [Nitrosotalea sp.]
EERQKTLVTKIFMRNLNDFFNENFTYERIQEVVTDLQKYSKCWLNIFHANDNNPLIKSGLERLKKVESGTYYPFLLSVYNEFTEGRLNKEDFV